MEIAITLTESNFDREVNNSEKPVLVDFWAEWCGPCKLIAPLIEEIAREKGDAIKVGKVNIDENQNLSFKFNIRAIPTLLIFKNGQVRDQVTGMTSKKDLVGRIDALGVGIFALTEIPEAKLVVHPRFTDHQSYFSSLRPARLERATFSSGG